MRPYRLAWPRTPAFHAGDRGSNPLRDAFLFKIMSNISTPGIILKKFDFSEKDKIVLLFTLNLSKISAIGIKAKKSQKRKLNLLDYWFLLDIKISTKKKYPLYIIQEVELIEDLTPIDYKPFHFLFLSICNEIISNFTYGLEEAKNLFIFYINFFKFFKFHSQDIIQKLAIFKVLTLSNFGLKLYNKKCIVCGKEGYFLNYSIEKNGFVCNECFKEGDISLSISTLKSIEFLGKGKFNVKLSQKMVEEIDKIFYLNLFQLRGEEAIKRLNWLENLLKNELRRIN